MNKFFVCWLKLAWWANYLHNSKDFWGKFWKHSYLKQNFDTIIARMHKNSYQTFFGLVIHVSRKIAQNWVILKHLIKILINHSLYRILPWSFNIDFQIKVNHAQSTPKLLSLVPNSLCHSKRIEITLMYLFRCKNVITGWPNATHNWKFATKTMQNQSIYIKPINWFIV